MKKIIVGTLAAAIMLGTAARAQFPPNPVPPVAVPTTPPTAFSGTLTSVRSGSAVLQVPGGQQLTVTYNRSTLLIDATSEPLSPGMRVYVVGAMQGDGSVAASQIAVVAGLQYMQTTPAPATAPTVVPTQ